MNYIIPRMLEDLENGIDKKDIRYYIFGKPMDISDDIANAGAICINPIRTLVQPVSTGIRDRSTATIEVILIKSIKTQFNRSYNIEEGISFLTRIMEGRDTNNILDTHSVRYIIRENLKRYGVLQPTVEITWDDNRFRKDGVATATMTITIVDIDDQILN